MNFIVRAENYISDVQSGNELVCKYVVQAVERHIQDLEVAPERGWIFNKKAANVAMKFIALLKHTKGRKFAGKPFILEPWQCFIVYVLFGWQKADGLRRFSTAYVEIAKKNGKTAFAAAIADYLLILDGEPQAEVYCAATKKDQAKICFNQSKDFIEKNTEILKASGAKFVTNNVNIPSTGSKMEPIGRDSYGLDGINPSGAVIDEYHEWQNDAVRDSIESAAVGRQQTLMFIITTAGFNKEWPCFNYRKVCLDILSGIKKQEDTFAIIYTLDEGDDWKDETNWKKACPNLGISVELDKMREEFTKAINRGGQKEVSFKTKNLNLWVDAPTVWIQDEKFIKCKHAIKPEDLKTYPCFGGLDIASHVDINAYLLHFPETPIPGVSAYLAFFWMPRAKMEEQQDKVDYRRWVDAGHIRLFYGNVLEPDVLAQDIYEINQRYNVQRFAYDPYKAYHGTIQWLINNTGWSDEFYDEYNQGIRNMSEPTNAFEAEVTSGNCEFFANPVMRWMLRNVQIKRDKNGNQQPDKAKSINKIDGIVAAVVAKGTSMSSEELTDGPGIAYFPDITI